jgi:hypothetical protein
MAHKTFISYKYSDAQNLRDEIIEALGNDATYYKGEDGFSDDLSSKSAETIKEYLKDMMYDTSVTIVIISPNMIQSKWIDWEIEYCLKNITRKYRTSQTNGIVGVIMKVDGGYDWLTNHYTNCHSSPCINYKKDKLYPIIHQNQFNSNPPIQHCPLCQTFDFMNGSYISFVEEELFLQDTQKYIDNAYDKSENDASGYDITKKR